MPDIVGTGSQEKIDIPVKMGRYQIPRYPFDGPMPFDAEPVEGTGIAVPYTRVSTILDTHKNKEGIAKWKQRHIAKGMGDREDLVALAAATRLSDKTGLDKICEQAFDYAQGQASANRGSALHGFLERWFEKDNTLVIPEKWRADVSAVVSKFQLLGITIRPELQEMVIVRPDLSDGNSAGLAGRLDLVLEVPSDLAGGESDLVIADYKTGSDPLMYGAWEIQQQGGTYGSGWAVWDGRFWRPMPKIRRDFMLMVHVLPGHADVRVHQIDIDPEEVEADLAAAYRTRDRVKRARKAHRLFDPTPAAPTPSFVPTPASPTPDAAEQISIRDARLEKLSQVMGAVPDDDEDPSGVEYPDLAPMAGPGKRGCGVCGRTGHKRGSDKCLGDLDPARNQVLPDAPVLEGVSGPVDVVEDDGDPIASQDSVTEHPETRPVGFIVSNGLIVSKSCPHGQWTRNPITGLWECGLDDCFATAETSDREAETPEPDPFEDGPSAADWSLFNDRISSATSKAELRNIRAEATDLGVWDDGLKASALARLETLNSTT